jgi:hypothetical protein
MHAMQSQYAGDRELNIEIIDGFQSRETCNKAGTTISLKLIRETAKHLSAEKAPAVNYNCTKITK